MDHYFSCTIYHWIIISHALYTIGSLFLMHYISMGRYFLCIICVWIIIFHALYTIGSLFLMHYIPIGQLFSGFTF